MEQKTSKTIITDCELIAGELLSTLKLTHELASKQTTHLHLYHKQTLETHGTKIALLLQHKVEIFLKQEILEPFQAFFFSLQEKYPMLFCREIPITIVE